MKKRFYILGIGIVLGYGKKNEILNYFNSKKSKRRKLGILDGKAQMISEKIFL